MCSELFVQAFLPSYADTTYPPWYAGHAKQSALDEDVLNDLFQQMRSEQGCGPEVMEDFSGFLDSHGYTIFQCGPVDGVAVIRVPEDDPQKLTCMVCDKPGGECDELESTYCGSIHPSCAGEHAKECEVCRQDFVDRGWLDPLDFDMNRNG